MVENRVLIKINYDKDKRRKELIDPKIVTVWHTGRIFGVTAILVLLTIPILFWFSGEKIEENNPSAVEISKDTNNAPLQKDETSIASITDTPTKTQVIPSPKTIASPSSAIIFDKRVIRASLSEAPHRRGPGKVVKTPVIIEPGQTRELFYFSEIKNMEGKVLFHHWLKNGKLTYKKRFTVKEDKSKLISSRKLNDKDTGEWRTMLIDNNGKTLGEVKFSIHP